MLRRKGQRKGGRERYHQKLSHLEAQGDSIRIVSRSTPEGRKKEVGERGELPGGSEYRSKDVGESAVMRASIAKNSSRSTKKGIKILNRVSGREV